MFQSLRARLIALSVAIVTVAMLALAIANFLTVQRHVLSTLDDQSRQLVNAQAQVLGEWVATKRLLTHTLAQAVDTPEPRAVVQALRDGGGFSDAYFGYTDKRMFFLNEMAADYDVTARPWFRQALKEGRPIVTAPYLFVSPPEVGVTFAEPVGPAGNPVAVVGTDVLLTTVVRTVGAIRPTPGSFAFLVDEAGAIVTHPDPALTLKPVSALSPQLRADAIQALPKADSGMRMAVGGKDFLLYGQGVPGTNWQLVVAVQRDEALSALGSLLKVSGAIVAISLILAIALLGAVIARVTRRLAVVRDALEDIASGDGDLTRRLSVQGNDELTQIARAFNHFTDKIASVLVRIRESSETVRHASTEIASGNQDLSARTEQQASSLEETAAAMEQLTATVQHNAENARQARQLASSASDIATHGGTVVDQVVRTMGGIEQSSHRIADIIGVIDSIAFQTNILALNAAVEAARAGEQGRGFAVVASEVRTLAQRSATAAKEIKALIDDSVGQVDAGSRLVQDAGATMGKVVESVQRVTAIVTEISNASQEQSTGIAEIGTAVSQMDQSTQQNAALVEEATAAAQSLQQQAAQLADVVAGFRLDSESSRSRSIALHR
ncbi:Methyl-accepting chemotaxis protein II|uniref:methyl-accepting chemotaxis protein n=1 Tax=Delftia acidovorans TaxID=80866 RepID=UPI001C0B649C|nr:methyl-accepting chemotaxis protein [Delftia acidovorans]MCA1070378.1 Methyl-accepting chemotaxis protein II [Delftia acidovorans]